jgi:hypothetical protein
LADKPNRRRVTANRLSLYIFAKGGNAGRGAQDWDGKTDCERRGLCE